MSREKIRLLHLHLNLRIELKQTMILFCYGRVDVNTLNRAIDAVEYSTVTLTKLGYVEAI